MKKKYECKNCHRTSDIVNLSDCPFCRKCTYDGLKHEAFRGEKDCCGKGEYHSGGQCSSCHNFCPMYFGDISLPNEPQDEAKEEWWTKEMLDSFRVDDKCFLLKPTSLQYLERFLRRILAAQRKRDAEICLRIDSFAPDQQCAVAKYLAQQIFNQNNHD